MFTGIIESTTPIKAIDDSPDGTLRRLSIISPSVDVRLGESIAINGVCLTVADITENLISFDVIAETLAKTNLGRLKVKDAVNLERSLRAGDRIDGHFVQGHVDGVATVRDWRQSGGDVRLCAEAPAHLARYLIKKGSVCLDGVSLTIAAVNRHEFEVALIPTTLNMTTLGQAQPGWPLNMEADIMTKTIVATLERMRFPIQD